MRTKVVEELLKNEVLNGTELNLANLGRYSLGQVQRVVVEGVVVGVDGEQRAWIQSGGVGVECRASSAFRGRLMLGDAVKMEGLLSTRLGCLQMDEARVRLLRREALPEPSRPKWESVASGFHDGEWMQLEGLVQDIKGDVMHVRTKEGVALVRLSQADEVSLLSAALGMAVRVKGVAEVKGGDQVKILLSSIRQLSLLLQTKGGEEEIALLKVAYLNDFLKEKKSESSRVTLIGLISHLYPGGGVLWDGQRGVRFLTNDMTIRLKEGMRMQILGRLQSDYDLCVVDAEGTLLGQELLPEPQWVEVSDLMDGRYDATRVKTRAQVVALASEEDHKWVELQSGDWHLEAHFPEADFQASLAEGDWVEVTGVCLMSGGARLGTPFQANLWMHSSSDLEVIEARRWWHERWVWMTMGFALAATGLMWRFRVSRMARKSVGEDESPLDIRYREAAEQRRAVLEERSRIARDLHDELGAKVTKIVMLAEQEVRGNESTSPRVKHLFDTTQELTRVMDEVVWTVNPRNDSLVKLVNYLMHYAESYFEGSGVRVKLRQSGEIPAIPVTASERHDLHLAVKEALGNVLKHSGATECSMEVRVENESFLVTVVDNGRGYDAGGVGGLGNGLVNMRHRIERVGGECRMESALGKGTRVEFKVLLNRFAGLAADGPDGGEVAS